MKNNLLVTLIIAVVFCVSGGAFAKESVDDKTLRVALLAIPDVLPVYVAEANGYFKEAGIKVEILPVGSAVERDQLLQAGRIDGMINEIGGAALFNRDKVQMKIVSYARVPLKQRPLFRILSAPSSGIIKVEQLAGVKIAVSRNTVIEYITERLLEEKGLKEDDIAYVSVPVLPERMQLLLSGQIKAATLPDPLAFAAIQAGAVEVISDLLLPELSASVVSFSEKAVTGKKESVKKFMQAWDRAAKDLNDDPEKYRELMLARIRVPKNVQKSFTPPLYPRGKIPSRAQWDDIQRWLIKKGLLQKEVAYDVSVTSDFVVQQ